MMHEVERDIVDPIPKSHPKREPAVLKDVHHGSIGREDGGPELPDVSPKRDRAQLTEQARCEPTVLHSIEHREGDLGASRFGGTDIVLADRDDLAGRVGDQHDMLSVFDWTSTVGVSARGEETNARALGREATVEVVKCRVVFSCRATIRTAALSRCICISAARIDVPPRRAVDVFKREGRS